MDDLDLSAELSEEQLSILLNHLLLRRLMGRFVDRGIAQVGAKSLCRGSDTAQLSQSGTNGDS